MEYRAIYNGYDAASLTQEKVTEIKRSADDSVAQTRCVQDKSCRHLKTEVGSISGESGGIMKREVKYVGFVVTLSCEPITGT